MDLYEQSRRSFLRKLGLSFGATLTTSAMLSANVQEPEAELLTITPEQQTFMNNYEKWMDEFIEVIRIQKSDPDNYENNKHIVQLSEEAKTWQKKLTQYMLDENFSRVFMIRTERMTKEI